tara:strand:- start:40995 stop:41360 length:366 start_codon:yes stop_codon:yes gene_type:complete
MKWILDKLMLLGVVILVLGAVVAIKIYNPFSHDNDIVGRSGELAIELCECTGPSCAERILANIEEEIVGKKVSGGVGSAHSKAHEQIMHAEKCFLLISQGKKFSVSKKDGMIGLVQESLLN